MNKIYKVKRNKFGESVVTSELAKSHNITSLCTMAMAGLVCLSLSTSALAQPLETVNLTGQRAPYSVQAGKIYTGTLNLTTVASSGALNTSVSSGIYDVFTDEGLNVFVNVTGDSNTRQVGIYAVSQFAQVPFIMDIKGNIAVNVNGIGARASGINQRRYNNAQVGGFGKIFTYNDAEGSVKSTAASGSSEGIMIEAQNNGYEAEILAAKEISSTVNAGTQHSAGIWFNQTGTVNENSYLTNLSVQNVGTINGINNGSGIGIGVYANSVLNSNLTLNNVDLINVQSNATAGTSAGIRMNSVYNQLTANFGQINATSNAKGILIDSTAAGLAWYNNDDTKPIGAELAITGNINTTGNDAYGIHVVGSNQARSNTTLNYSGTITTKNANATGIVIGNNTVIGTPSISLGSVDLTVAENANVNSAGKGLDVTVNSNIANTTINTGAQVGSIALSGTGNAVHNFFIINAKAGALSGTGDNNTIRNITLSGENAQLGAFSINHGTNNLTLMEHANYTASGANAGSYLSSAEIGTGSTLTLSNLTNIAASLRGSGTLNLLNNIGNVVLQNNNSSFNGVLNLDNTSFSLTGFNAVFANQVSDVSVSNGGVLSVTAAGQSIKNLTLNDGSASFVSGATLTTGKFIATGSNGIRVDVSPVGSGNGSAVNLIDQTSSEKTILVTAMDISDVSIDDLILQNTQGQNLSDNQVTITQNNQDVALGSYSYNLNLTNTTGNAGQLEFDYGLSALEINNAKTLVLDSTTATKKEMTAQITGSGNLSIISENMQGLVLNNINNNYTGETTVSVGTVTAGSTNSFGQTSKLNVSSGATVNLNDKAQIIGSLANSGTINLGEKTGSLTISDGGTSTGVLVGTGILSVTGGELTLAGLASEDLEGQVKISDNAILTIAGGSIGESSLELQGTLNVTAGYNISLNSILGSGIVNTAGNLTLIGNNSQFTGDINITDGAKVVAFNNSRALGTGAVNLQDESAIVEFNSVNNPVGNVIQGNGIINITNTSRVTLVADNSNFVGTINNQGTLNVSNQSQVGLSKISNIGNLVFNNYNNNPDSNGYSTLINNVITGTGNVGLTDSSILLTDTKNFSGVTGALNINENSDLKITNVNQLNKAGSAINLNALTSNLTVNTDGSMTWNRKLNGNGSLNINTNNQAFNFGAGFGNTFAGIVNLTDSTFTLSGNNAAALGNSTLVVGKGNITTVSNIGQKIGNLSLNGGTLEFTLTSDTGKRFGSIETNDFQTSSDKKSYIRLDLTAVSNDISMFNPDSNLLNHIGTNSEILVQANASSTFDPDDLILQNIQNGQDVGADTAYETDIKNEAGTANAAKATYNYTMGRDKNNLTVGYALVQLDLLSGETLVLNTSGTDPNKRDMSAKITGQGNLELRSDDEGLTISDSDNDYTGITTVSSGLIIAGDDNAFGQTSELNIFSGATVDLNTKSQTIGKLMNRGILDLANGALTITDGGLSDSGNGLVGTGELTVASGEFIVSDMNKNFKAAIAIVGGSLTLSNAGTLGSSTVDIQDNGSLNLNIGSIFANSLSGTGAANINNHVELSGKSTDFKGAFNIGNSLSLTITNHHSLGAATIKFGNEDSSLVLKKVAGTINSKFSDKGLIDVIEGSNVTLAGDSTGFEGEFFIGGESNLVISANNQLGNGVVEIEEDSSLSFDKYNETLNNNISGAGNINIANSHVSLVDKINFKGISGAINLNESSNLTITNVDQLNSSNSTINLNTLASNLNVNVNEALTWDRRLDGIGSLNINTTGNSFNLTADFGTSLNESFKGTVHLTNSTFDLSDSNTTALRDATLAIGEGNITTVSKTQQNIGNLTFDGGTLVFGLTNDVGERFGSINTNALVTTDKQTNIQLDLSQSNIIPDIPFDPESNLLNHIGENREVLIQGTKTDDFNLDALVLQNTHTGGSSSYTSDIKSLTGSNIVAEATYDYKLFKENHGLEIGFGLTKLSIVERETLVLTTDGVKDNNHRIMTAQITDKNAIGGNLELRSDDIGLTISNSNNNYTGTTAIISGLVIAGSNNAFGQTSGLNISEGTSLDLNNKTQTIGANGLYNAGTINFNNNFAYRNLNVFNQKDSGSRKQLIIEGDYIGVGKASIYMNVDLGNDRTSKVEQIIIEGDARGSTALYLTDLGKVSGAQTSKTGVKLIEVGGISDANAFILGDRVVKGAYEYNLYRNTADQDWYLSAYIGGGDTNNPDNPNMPTYRPDVGNIFGNVNSIIKSQVPGYGGGAISNGMVGGLGGLASLDRLMTEDGRYLGSVWSSNTAAKNKGRALNNQIHFSSETYNTVLGADTGFTSGKGLWILGGMLGLGHTKTDSHNRLGDISKTKGDTTSSTFGIYGTWYQDYQNVLSPYVGFSATYSKFDNKINLSGIDSYKYDSHATIVTLNGGYPLAIQNGLVLEPQGQLSYVNYKSDHYRDHSKTDVKEKLDGNMIYRAGLFVYPQTGDFKPYAGVNLWYDSTRTKVRYDSDVLKSDKAGFSYELKAGFNFQATKNFSVSTEVNYSQGKSHNRDYSANIGLKYQF